MNQEEFKAIKDKYIERLTTIRNRVDQRWDKEATPDEQVELRAIIDDIDSLEKQGITHNIYKPDPASGMSVGTDRAGLKPFDSLGEQLVAIRNAGVPGGQSDARLFNVRAASGLNEGTPSDGGFLVQTDYANEIMRNVFDHPIPSRINKIQVSGNSNGLKMNGFDETSRADGSRSGGIQAYWAAEAAQYTASTPKYRQITLELNKLVGLCYVTDEVLEDATALESTVGAAFQDEFAFKIGDSILHGSGAGMPLGITQSSCLVTVNKETGQAAATIVWENIIKMWSRLLPASTANAVFLINKDCLPSLLTMSMAVGTGGAPVYMPADGAAGRPFNTLLGRPVIAVEQCKTLGTLGDILLVDLSKYIAIDKGALRTDYSIHVRFIYGEGIFRATYRFDGQPMLSSAITPANSTDTMSHFVALQSRT